MVKKLLLCFPSLLALSAIVTVSVAVEDSAEISIESKETAEGTTSASTTNSTQKAKVNRAAIEKRILHTFRLKSDPKEKDFEEFLKAMEYSDNDRKTIRNAPHIDVNVSKRGRKLYTLWVTAGMVTVCHLNYELGEEFTDKLFDGRSYKGTITFEGSNKVIKEEKHLGFNCRHESVFTKKGFTITYECKGKKAVQEFKRKDRGDENDQKKQAGNLKFKFGG